MPRFYFHHYLDGQFVDDPQGLDFADQNAAREYAVHLIPAILAKTVRATANTFFATEISDGEQTLCVVRSKVIVGS